MLHPYHDPDNLINQVSEKYGKVSKSIITVNTFNHLTHDGNITTAYTYNDENGKSYIAKDNMWVEFANQVFGEEEMYYGDDDYDSGVDDVHYNYMGMSKTDNTSESEDAAEDFSPTKFKKTTKTEVSIMNQFMTLDIGSNKATIDLSKVRKQGLVFEKTMFGRKPKIVIYYNDRPDVPEVNFELNSEDEAQSVYKKINAQLEKWADESNSAQITRLERELEVMREQKTAILEEKDILMNVFNSFKEMMQIMEDDTKTSKLLSKIESM